MSKIFLITGNHPRHFFLAWTLAKTNDLVGWVIEDRGDLIPKNLIDHEDLNLRELYTMHFKKRYDAEYRFFIEEPSIDMESKKFISSICPNIKNVSKEELNGPSVIEFITSLDIEIAFSYGCHILQNHILQRLPSEKYNFHGGISPWYRGCITHFWPSYMLEPQMTGMTMHRLTPVLDGGEIIHQNSGELVRGDGLHSLTSRTVKSFFEETPKVVQSISKGDYSLAPQKSSGKLWLASDWHPNHLKIIYEYFEDKIVDYCLDNKIEKVKKNLVRL